MKQPFPEITLPTPQQMAQIDKLAARHSSIRYLMGRAGWAVAHAIKKHFKPQRVLVLCGPGNNGGDGYAAARYLQQAGWPVAIAHYYDRQPRSEDAAYYARLWDGVVVPYKKEEVKRTDLVVDALFGAGLSKPLDETSAHMLSCAKRIVAVDIPSGVDGENGHLRGNPRRADLTVTFFRPKPGHYILPGREYTGLLELYDIGISLDVLDRVGVTTWENKPSLWCLPPIGVESHKYTRGVVSVCGGGEMPGAARLAAHGARAVGAGLVRIAAGENAPLYKTGAAGLIVDSLPVSIQAKDERQKVWICGPGLNEKEVRFALPPLLDAGKTILADAGALSAAAGRPGLLSGVSVVTPHAGEFAKVFGTLEQDKVKAAQKAAVQINAVIVLKGADTIIAAPDGRVAINHHAPPDLGTAGSGDTLSGIIAGLLAGGMPPWQAACAGVWIHGEAGFLAGPYPLAEDLGNYIGLARKNAERGQGK